MKKTVLTCLAIVALFAIATSASAITCTIDQRPSATLLVPYFQVSFNADGTPLTTGLSARDTIVTICNASSAPMIAHYSVFNERSFLVLDFNVALTGFDCQSVAMSDILSGKLPSTGWVDSDGKLRDACQRDPDWRTYPDPRGFLRVNPTNPAVADDNTRATTRYPSPAFGIGSAFEFQILDSMDDTSDQLPCNGNVIDNVISGPIRGYMTIDHANYCNLSNPSASVYYSRDAIGMENNLWGEVIHTSGSGIPTYGDSTVDIEADPSLQFQDIQTDATPLRTFYRRYWSVSGGETFCGNCTAPCTAGAPPLGDTTSRNLNCNAPFDEGYGDEREPLGLKYAARWFQSSGVSSFFRVWRASAGTRTDLTGPLDTDGVTLLCLNSERIISLSFYDEDENTVTSGTCPSPCAADTFNFPRETQRRAVTGFSRPPGAVAGWVSMSFLNNASNGNFNGRLDQAWVEYEFDGAAAFISAGIPATQLDPSTCNPIGVTGVQGPIAPVFPALGGRGPNQPSP